ncbi:hypothetical protein AA313_de0201400 [Arthrobotrys entomopaga]|nr:hypothetical protein AA313_de0201400 [Arthrobotrys entomopaga]
METRSIFEPENILNNFSNNQDPPFCQNNQLFSFPARKALTFLTNQEVSNAYENLNFEFRSGLNPIIEVADVFLPRSVQNERIPSENQDSWFAYPTSKHYLVGQTWRHCDQDDARLLRDIYCGYNLAIHKILEEAGAKAESPDIWTDVWVEPCEFVVSMYKNFGSNPDEVSRIWTEYGIDLFKFVELQYEMRSAPYSFKPNATRLAKNTIYQEGRNTYLLTFQKLPDGKFKVRRFPPQLIPTSSVHARDASFEFNILPDIWHPHHGVSKAFTFPSYLITPHCEWLRWDVESGSFKGTISSSLENLHSVLKDGRICLNLTALYSLNVGSASLELVETATTRVYLKIPERPSSPVVIDSGPEEIQPPNPLVYLWNSHKLGFDLLHSQHVANKARVHERQIRLNYSDADAQTFGETGRFPWRPYEPIIQSLGSVTWSNFLNHQRLQVEKNKRTRYTQPGLRYDPMEWDRDVADVDLELEETKRTYENMFHEAQVIIWLNTIYRERMQERLEDEAFDDFEAKLETDPAV